MWWIALGGLLAACSRPDPLAELGRYSALLASPGEDADAAFELCDDLSDDQLRGDCGLAMAQHFARKDGRELTSWCGRVSRGVWRDECVFIAAEEARRAGRQDEAGRLCLESGSFVDDCVQHLWQNELRFVIHVQHQAPDFAGRLAKAEGVYARWSSVLDREDRWRERYWLRYYQMGFESARHIDLAWCDPLTPEHKARCVEAARQSVYAELPPRVSGMRGIPTFCAMEQPGTGEVARWMSLSPSPLLDEIIRERQTAMCSKREGI